MAKTMVKRHLLVNPLDDPLFGFLTRHAPEGADQTFTGCVPLVASTGRLVEATSPLNPSNEQVVAFALEAGSNVSSPGAADTIEVVLAAPFLIIEGNFMTDGGADNVLAAGDLYANCGLESDTDFPGTGDGGWYFEDGGTAAANIKEFDSVQVDSTINDYKPATGDTNARVRGVLLESAIAW